MVSETPGKSFRGGGHKYDVLDLLGEGAYGSVYRCSRVHDGAFFAVKIVDPRKMAFAVGSVNDIQGLELLVNREVEALRRLSVHPGIVTLQAVLWSKATRQTFIVTELVPGRNLFPVVSSRTQPFMEAEVAHIAAQVSNALAFCHSQGVAHRDIKLENVLVSSISVDLVSGQSGSWQTCELYEVKLCDFGLAKVLQGANTTRTAVGTSVYAAPEITSEAGKPYDAMKADAYSFGVLVFVMLCLDFPAKEPSPGEYWKNRYWPGLSPLAKSFVSSLLESNPLARLSTAQASGRQWLSQAQLSRADDLQHHHVEFENIGTESIGGAAVTGSKTFVGCASPSDLSSVDEGNVNSGAPSSDQSSDKERLADVSLSSSGACCGCRRGLKKLLQSMVDQL
jgi:serine/threonine protein kinase